MSCVQWIERFMSVYLYTPEFSIERRKRLDSVTILQKKKGGIDIFEDVFCTGAGVQRSWYVQPWIFVSEHDVFPTNMCSFQHS